MTELINSLKNRYVRDLAWACFSPSLLHTEKLADDQHNVANCGLSLTSPRATWLQLLDQNPAALIDFLDQKNHTRLGLYFEQLWHFFLQEDPDVDLVAHNLPVREKGRTLGEFDCLYFCHQRQRHYHLELAVKYFLAHEGSANGNTTRAWQAWLGPNCRDRLDLKVEHMLQRQIRLAEQPAAQALLGPLGIESLTGEVEIKGWLFANGAQETLPPQGHNAARPLQNWLPVNTLQTFLSEQQFSGLAVLPRLQWLAPALRQDVEVMSVKDTQEQVSRHFATTVRPLLVAAFGDSDLEQERFFVTNPEWPRLQGELSA
ncbi:MAG: DUF1853 family protein [Halieaceae bacterium]